MVNIRPARPARPARTARSFALLLTVLALLAAACGGAEEPADTGDAGAADAPATDAPAEGTEGAAGEATEAAAAEGDGLTLEGEEIADAELWAAAQEEGGLTLYTALSEAREIEIVDAFMEQTGLDVEIVRLPGGRLYERVLSEAGAGVISADVLRQTDITLATDYVENGGIWEVYCHPFWELIPEDVKNADCNFFSSQSPIYAIGYNSAVVDEADAPQTWEDLLDPQWQGNLVLAHIGAGGSTWARDLFLREEFGVEYWEQLAAQNPIITGGAGAVTETMATGEAAVGMVLPGSQGLAAADGAPLEVVVPDRVPGYNQWLGLVQNAENPNAAKVFVNWNASLAGQNAIATVGDYPVREDADAPAVGPLQMPPLAEIDVFQAEQREEYATQRDAWMEEWFSIFGYTPEG